jgi:glutathione synthase/RimK-type ligase-like ATP-grasp enzyme
MHILLVSEKTSHFVTSRLIDEAQKRGHSIDYKFYNDLHITFDNGCSIAFGDTHLGKYDAVMLRMAEGRSMIFYKDIITKELAKNAYVLNGETYTIWPTFGKIVQNYTLISNGVPTVPSQLFATYCLTYKHDFSFPLILKQDMSRLGNGARKINDQTELEHILEEGSSHLLIQKFLTTGQDYRIFVIGGHAIPLAMQKTAPQGKFITNYSLKMEKLKNMN